MFLSKLQTGNHNVNLLFTHARKTLGNALTNRRGHQPTTDDSLTTIIYHVFLAFFSSICGVLFIIRSSLVHFHPIFLSISSAKHILLIDTRYVEHRHVVLVTITHTGIRIIFVCIKRTANFSVGLYSFSANKQLDTPANFTN